MSRPQPDQTAIDPEVLLERAATQLGTVGALIAGRGSVAGAERLADATRRLFTMVDQLDGYAAGRAQMLRGAAEVALSYQNADPDPYGAAMAGLDEAPRRRAWRVLARLRGGVRHDA